jgi:RNA polymerase sigma factor (sigma-70 family)
VGTAQFGVRFSPRACSLVETGGIGRSWAGERADFDATVRGRGKGEYPVGPDWSSFPSPMRDVPGLVSTPAFPYARILAMDDTQRQGDFPATRWSVILRAAGEPTLASRAALEDLCRLYWPPLYAFLRRSGHSPEDAQDLVQGYLARLLEREDLARVGPEKGRFRSYLLAGLRNFLVSEARRDGALKRGGGTAIFSLEMADAEALYGSALPDDSTPDLAYERRWATGILERALEALRQEHLARGKGPLYETLKGSLAGSSGDDYAALAGRLGMTAGAVAVAIHRLRLRLRELVRAEVAQTVGSAADLEEEMRNLLRILLA